MNIAPICFAVLALVSSSFVFAKDSVANSPRKPLQENVSNPRESKQSKEGWQPYFRWHRDAIAAGNRDDNLNEINRGPAIQL